MFFDVGVILGLDMFFEPLMTTGIELGSERFYPRPWLAKSKSIILGLGFGFVIQGAEVHGGMLVLCLVGVLIRVGWVSDGLQKSPR